jgi:hypothetical protein
MKNPLKNKSMLRTACIGGNRSVPIEAGVVSGVLTAVALFVLPAAMYGKQSAAGPRMTELIRFLPDSTAEKFATSAVVGLVIGLSTWALQFLWAAARNVAIRRTTTPGAIKEHTVVGTDRNPYRSPTTTDHPNASGEKHKKGIAISVFMILAGAFFCIASFFAVFSHGLDWFWRHYRSSERFWLVFTIFYGTASGLTMVLHLSYLLRGRPKQAMAGLYALAIALGTTFVGFMLLEAFAP